MSTQLFRTLTGLGGGQSNTPVKEEAYSGAERMRIFVHQDATTFPTAANGSYSRETESDRDVSFDPQRDVVFSLADLSYKSVLEPHIKAVAEMKRQGLDHDINERTEDLMIRFRDKISRMDGKFYRTDRRQTSYEEIDDEIAKKSKFKG